MNAFLELTRRVGVKPLMQKVHVEVIWVNFEKEIGVALPEDYKCIIDFYGAGCFFDYFFLGLPIRYGTPRLVDLIESLNSLRSIRDQGVSEGWISSDWRVPIWPENDGLFPIATSCSDIRLYWRTCGTPNQWTICVEADSFSFTHFPLTLSEYLVGLISEKANQALFYSHEGLKIIPNEISKMPWFEPVEIVV